MFGIDPKQFFGGDAEAFAGELQQSATSGNFDPFALLTGSRRFHSCCIAPLPPAMRAAITQLETQGDGPLLGSVKQLEQDGMPPTEALAQAKLMFSRALGLMVVIFADAQGLQPMPHLFFGNLEDDYLDAVAKASAQHCDNGDAIMPALRTLRTRASAGRGGIELFASSDGEDDAARYWQGLGEQLLAGFDEGIVPGAAQRSGELPYWIAEAIQERGERGEELDGEDFLIQARCRLIAGDIPAATTAIAHLLEDFEPEDEALVVLIEDLVNAAIRAGEPLRAVDCIDAHRKDINGILGRCYELPLARFKALAAAQSDGETLLRAAQDMEAANRKSVRHDLNKERLWLVTIDDPGTLLDTHAAAEWLDRSTNFVAKRLEQGAIPHYRSGEELRIPQPALQAWKTVMDHFKLLD